MPGALDGDRLAASRSVPTAGAEQRAPLAYYAVKRVICLRAFGGDTGSFGLHRSGGARSRPPPSRARALVALGSDFRSPAGQPRRLDVRLNGSLPRFVPNDEALAAGADVVFLCVGNERAALVEPPDDAVVVDLSGVHRLVDPELALCHYPAAPGSWSYGLPELNPPEGRLIANPGCAATATLTGARAAQGRARCRFGRDRRKVRRLGCRPRAQAELPRRLRAREPVAVPRRHCQPHA